ncbi:MAG: glutamate--cysteine ligase [Alphaproteobacteria bacterium]
MSGPSKASQEPVENRHALVAYLESGCKPPANWRIGTEHEKFGFRLDDLRPLPYDGPAGIRAMLDGLTRFGWEPYYEGDNVIALGLDGQAVSLEPGGQFELSGAPLSDLHQTCSELNTHLAQVREVAAELGVGFLGLGAQPKWRREDIHWMPKGRYKIMRRYMPTRGTLGLDMMTRTCTVQVNLDFESEADMVRKLRIGMALQPVATALFANSPFIDGAPSGYLSYRSQIWTDTDPDRCGVLPFVFEPGMGFERYVDYALDVPMYFVMRDGRYVDVAGQSFRAFMAGKLDGLPGERPTIADWDNHLTTLFPEVRLKRYLEMRGADGGPWRRLCALPALWVGLLYDPVALDEADQLCRGWSAAEVIALRDAVPKRGFEAVIAGRTALEVARDMLAIARRGLARRAVRGMISRDETEYLGPIEAIAEAGRTPAEELLEAYETRWNRSVDPVFRELAY